MGLGRAGGDGGIAGRAAPEATATPKIRVGTLAIPLDTVEAVDLTPGTFDAYKLQVLAVEQERYGPAAIRSNI